MSATASVLWRQSSRTGRAAHTEVVWAAEREMMKERERREKRMMQRIENKIGPIEVFKDQGLSEYQQK